MAKEPTYEELEHRIQELEKTEYELKQAEAGLRINEERYRLSQAISHVGNWELTFKKPISGDPLKPNVSMEI